MKVVRFQADDGIRYGKLADERLLALEGDIFGVYRVTTKTYALENVKLLAPVVPSKVICIGLNYASHVGEFKIGLQIPEEPIIFMVSPTAVVGPEEPIVLAKPGNRVDYEAELTIVIGKEGRNITKEEAAAYIFGYTCGNDVSDRILQKKDGQWTRAKSFHTYKPLGPCLVTDIDPNNCQVQCRINGKLCQNGNTRDMIKDVYYLVSYVSHIMTLCPGDVIMTGTPEGVGRIRSGDTCEVEIEGIGILRNPVKEAE